MNAFKALTVAGAVLALLSCGSEQKPIEITGAQAMGTVGGIVLNAVTREPLAGVKVTLIAGGAPTAGTTDAAGTFTFPQIPSGECSVTLDHEEYLSALVHGYLEGAGEYPINNASLTFGPIGLIPSTGTFTALLQFDDGSPAYDTAAGRGYTITARATTRFYDYSASYTSANSAQSVVVTAETDPTGLVSFSGLPDFILLGDSDADLLSIIVPPIPAPAGSPSLYRFPGKAFAFHMNEVGSIIPIIVLEQNNPTTLSILASNIQALEGAGQPLAPPIYPSIIAKGGPLYIAFNQALDPEATTVQLVEEGAPNKATPDKTSVVQTSMSYNVLQLSFSPELTGSSEYNLIIHAVSGVGDQIVRYDGWAPFFTEPTSTVLKPVEMTRETVNAVSHLETIHMTFAEPIGTGDPNVSFTGANCVLFFNAELTTDSDAGTNPGDNPGEIGNLSCNVAGVALMPEEPDPTGEAGQSGYTKYWKIQYLPVRAFAPFTPDVGTPFVIVFSRVTTPGMTMKRVNGELVPDFTGTLQLTLP